jgi:hypothetical protein
MLIGHNNDTPVVIFDPFTFVRNPRVLTPGTRLVFYVLSSLNSYGARNNVSESHLREIAHLTITACVDRRFRF